MVFAIIGFNKSSIVIQTKNIYRNFFLLNLGISKTNFSIKDKNIYILQNLLIYYCSNK